MKTKLLFALSAFLTSQAFAVEYCKISGTSNTVGVFPGDNNRRMSIYVQGRGYYAITDADHASRVYVSQRFERIVVLDLRNKTLEIDNQVLKLVKCVQNGSE